MPEEKAKRIDLQRRELARKARKEYDEYRRSLVATTQFVGKAMVALNKIREQRRSVKLDKPPLPRYVHVRCTSTRKHEVQVRTEAVVRVRRSRTKLLVGRLPVPMAKLLSEAYRGL